MNENDLNQGLKTANKGIFIAGFGGVDKEFPKWMYHEFFEPVIVSDKDEEKNAALQGWYSMESVPLTAKRHLVNWRYDLEDMTSKQLVLFAKEEFGVDLPVEASEEKLVKAMWHLTRIAPQNQGRVTLLAQNIEANYDELCDEVYKLAENLEFDSKEVVEL